MRDIGYHYRITDIQISLALSQLDKLDAFIQRRGIWFIVIVNGAGICRFWNTLRT